jgi:hypothetical protein
VAEEIWRCRSTTTAEHLKLVLSIRDVNAFVSKVMVFDKPAVD